MKICFLVQNIYPFFIKDTSVKVIGGAELQQYFIGKGLRDAGFEVSYLAYDYGQKKEEYVEGIRFIRTYQENSGISGLRFFYPRLFNLIKALIKADADIYYMRCAGYVAGILSIYCSYYQKSYVYAAAHDTDFIPGHYMLSNIRDKILYVYGLKRASAIIVQTNYQKSLLKKSFNLPSKVIQNIYPLISQNKSSNRKYILWVSNFKPWKRPEIFLDLADLYPDQEFVMIGGPDKNRDFFQQMQVRAADIPNLKFLGFQPFETTNAYFDQAKIFVNTSEYEGFPNTFLQAWSRGIPVLSFIDPDGLIQEHGLGIAVSDFQGLRRATGRLLSEYDDFSNRIKAYFDAKHSARAIDKYVELFEGLVNNK